MIYVYRALHAPVRYLGFVVLGGVLLAFWQNVIWAMATQFFWDRGQGNLELFAMAPTSLAAILLGMALGGAYLSLTRAVTVLVVASLLFGISYSIAGLLAALGYGTPWMGIDAPGTHTSPGDIYLRHAWSPARLRRGSDMTQTAAPDLWECRSGI